MNLQTRTKSRRRDTLAFTIADAIMAVFVLGTAGSAFCTAVSCGFIVMQNTREDLRATQILMQRMEAVRLCTWSQLSNFSFNEAYDPLKGGGQNGTTYYGNVTVEAVTNVPNTVSYAANLAQVTVNLNWTNYTRGVANPHNRQMQTQVARYGLQNYIWGAIQ